MNDQFDMALVLLTFFIAISYLNFLSVRLKNRSGWSNVTCNPINLFTNSLFQTRDQSNKEFKRCVEKLSTETTKQLFQNHVADQEKVIQKQGETTAKYDDFRAKVKGYENTVNAAKTEILASNTEREGSINTAKALNDTTTAKVQSFIEKIQAIFQNIRSYI